MLEKEIDDLIFGKKTKKMKVDEEAMKYLKYMVRKCPIELEEDKKEMIELQNCITKDYRNGYRTRSKSVDDVQKDKQMVHGKYTYKDGQVNIDKVINTKSNVSIDPVLESFRGDNVFVRAISSPCNKNRTVAAPLSPVVKILNSIFMILNRKQNQSAARYDLIDEELLKLRREVKNMKKEEEMKLLHIINMVKEHALESLDYVLVEIMKKDVDVSRSVVVMACELLVERINNRFGDNARAREINSTVSGKKKLQDKKLASGEEEPHPHAVHNNETNVLRYNEIIDLLINNFDSFMAIKHHNLSIPTYIVVATQRDREVLVDKRVIRECKKNLKLKIARTFYLKYLLYFDKCDIAIFRYCLSDDEMVIMRRHGGLRKVFRNFYYKTVKKKEWKRLWEFHSKASNYECERDDGVYNSLGHGLNDGMKVNGRKRGVKGTDECDSSVGSLDDLICLNCNHNKPSLLLTLKERIAIVNFITKKCKVDMIVINLLSIFHYKRLRELCLECVSNDVVFNMQIFHFLRKKNEHNFYVFFLSNQNEINLRNREELMSFCHFFMKWRIERWISVSYKYFYVYLDNKNVIDTFIRLVEMSLNRKIAVSECFLNKRTNVNNSKDGLEHLHGIVRYDEDKIVAWLSLEKMRDKNNVEFYNKLLYLMRLIKIKHIPFLDVFAQYEPYVLNTGCFVSYDKLLKRYLTTKANSVKRMLIASGDLRAKDFFDELVRDLERYCTIKKAGDLRGNHEDVSEEEKRENESNIGEDFDNKGVVDKNVKSSTESGHDSHFHVQDSKENYELPKMQKISPDYLEYKRKKTQTLLMTWLYAFPSEHILFQSHIDGLIKDDMLVEWLERFFVKEIVIKYMKYFMSKPHLYLNVLIKATKHKLVLPSDSVPIIIKHFKAPWFIAMYEDILLDLNFEIESKMLLLFYKFFSNRSALIGNFARRIDRNHLFILDELKLLTCRKLVVKCLNEIMYDCEAELFEVIDGFIDEIKLN
ncbi:hypothetical protein VCUG_00584 [Vavraia culicis subsp. floridensis]|uniref:Uncharacterized protein n=1 Tax=Vavraia culicis (isolate floridensis) TaxID=948595 RepID=L2GWF2_VAVCU|nr:uncharacterized protein VCUG_00584 [Vavraia culicis subsp. floridensis]ELA48001.1 hypothetical protein VCUG_00584 [Vavraia culicis subsp. floridensis]